jgi:diaminobutyrate-2-oxoglutarate transaminase
MAVVIYHKKLDLWLPGTHAGTFRGNQLAMAAGVVVMNRVSQPEFLAEVVAKGKIIMDRMEALKKEVSIIGDIRGRGLMIGIEFVDPKGTPDCIGSLPSAGSIATQIQKECFNNNLIMEKGGRYGSVMRCLCALNVSREDIDIMLDILETVIRRVDGYANS